MKILMVCLGNICRSPLAHGIMQARIDTLGLEWEVDSAGTSAYHQGSRPDERSIAEAVRHGIDITGQRSRQIQASDLSYYNLILTMDTSNYNDVRQLIQENSHLDKIKLLLDFVYPGQNRSVPDPYYNGGFSTVYEMIHQAVDRIVQIYSPVSS